jgi:uncharacterized damage-inducible protein DinB
MKPRSSSALFALFTLVLVGGPATAAKPGAPAAAAAPASKNAFQDDYLKLLDDVEKKILSLEDAVPQDKFKWRPAPGVRSISEAYLHIAYGNYTFTKIATGKEPPADSGYAMGREKWDLQTTDKAAIKKILEKSFAHVRAAVKALPDADLDKQVNFFGHDASARAVLISLHGHQNEHLGQAIAYARANNVTPPWSKG